MKTNFKSITVKILVLILISLFTFTNANFAKASSTTIRLSGQSRYETAKAIAEYYQQGKVKNVIFSTGNGFADALSASVLAHEKEAPILLVNTSVSKSNDAFDYVTRHLDSTGTVYIIGGTGVISKEFETKLSALGFNNIVRIAGNDRYETSYKLANSFNSASTVVIASGESYPDALSISSFAANKGWPILLTTKTKLPEIMKSFLLDKKPSNVYIIGGTGVISDDVKSQISEIVPQTSIQRLAGEDRFVTNTIIAQTFKPNPTTVYIASGYGFADALAGSSLAAKDGNPIIFINPTSTILPKSVESYFKSLNTNKVDSNIIAFGGNDVVSDTIIKNISNFILGKTDVIDLGSNIKNEEKMKTFGFDVMYVNKTAKSSETVTKTEALKLATAVTFNRSDIVPYIGTYTEYENQTWVEFAKFFEITNENINISNYNEKAKYVDVISYFEKYKIRSLTQQPVKSTDVNIKDLSSYSSEQQTAIKDMVANEIITLTNSTLNGNEYITKGQLNELVVNFAEKYSTIAMKGDTITTDSSKMPTNANLYPYILSNIDKIIYEKPFLSFKAVEKMSPKDSYASKKELYPQFESVSEGFFDTILNIDYRTITEQNFREKIEEYFIFSASDYAITQYVKHVKVNEIIIEGSSQVQFPIIYFDGSYYRPRVKLQFEVKHSKTKDNLLYLDMIDELKESYQKTNYNILVDYYLTNTSNANNTNMYIDERTLYNVILDKDNCGITKEIQK